MVTTRKFLRLATLATAGTLLACTNDVTIPIAPTPPVSPRRVLTSLEIQLPTSPLVPFVPLNTGHLEVRAKDQDGRPMKVDTGPFTISSDNPTVASVGNEQFWTSSSNGVPDDSWMSAQVTAIGTGKAVISVSWTIDGVTKTAKSTITVVTLEGWSLKVTPTVLTVQLGATGRIQAWVFDPNGQARTPYNAFTSDRAGVVDLSDIDWCGYWGCDDTEIRGLAVGETTLTARFQTLSDKVVVTVVPSK